MGLVVHWYDAACFAIVAAAVVGTLWVLVSQEEVGGRGCCGRTRARWHRLGGAYQSLLELGAGSTSSNSRGGVLRHRQLWTSCWECVHPAWLLAVRSVTLLCLVGMLWWVVVEYNLLIFVYYTEWTFGLVTVYFAIATVISADGCWSQLRRAQVRKETVFKGSSRSKGGGGQVLKPDLEEGHVSTTITTTGDRAQAGGDHRVQDKPSDDADAEEAGFWGHAMQITYQAGAGAAVLTDLVFWAVIVPFLSNERFGLNLLMGSMHTLNLMFLLIETALNSLPFPFFRMAYFVLWSCAYVVFQWILHACGFSWWPYPFLELSSPYAPLWYCCMALVHIPCYGSYFLVVKAKDRLLSHQFPQS